MILAPLLFSYQGKISRADFIYACVYVFLLSSVSLTVFVYPFSPTLFWGAMDTWYIIQYLLSCVGIIVSLWIWIGIIWKRGASLKIAIPWRILAIFIPFLALYGLKKDLQLFASRGPINRLDQAFFYTLIVWIIIAIWYIYRLPLVIQIIGTLFMICMIIILWLFLYDRSQERGNNRVKYTWIDSWLDLGFVIIIVFFVRIFIFSPFQIIGPSMNDTFYGWAILSANHYGDGEFIIVDKMSYRIWLPQRGDVVVFSPRIGPSKKYLIKRIIWEPGDRIKIEGGKVLVAPDGKDTFVVLNETYLADRNQGKTFVREAWESITYIVPQGRYFLMGDNRMESLDARDCFQDCTYSSEAQFVPKWAISWRVAFSLGHFDVFSQIFPYPKIGSLAEVVPFRWKNILNTFDYPGL